MNVHFRAWVYKLSGNFDKAIIDYQKALEIEPDYILALNGLAQLSIMSKEYDEAEEHLARVEKMSPDDRTAKSIRAWLCAAKNKKEEAFEFLEESGRILEEGGRGNRYHTIAVYSLLGLKEEAIKLLDNKPIAPYGTPDYLAMLHNSVFDILRDTEDFKVALQKAKEIYEENLLKYAEVFL